MRSVPNFPVYSFLILLSTISLHGSPVLAADGGEVNSGEQMPQPPAIVDEIKIDQDKLLAGDYSFRKVLESGTHLFTTPFTIADGMGEGGKITEDGIRLLGPREKDFNGSLLLLKDRLELDEAGFAELREVVMPPFAKLVHTDPDDPNSLKITFTFLRLNGLDSQSCFECHNSIGSARLSDTRSEALARQVGVTGGPAGFASNAFINGAVRNDKMEITEPGFPNPLFKFVRNPPHVFGTGYAQALAEEMSMDLMVLEAFAIGKAVQNAGKPHSQMMSSKGTDYGKIIVTYKGDEPSNDGDLRKMVYKELDSDHPEIDIDYSQLEGVSRDLAVRPFQWKGIASNERNFVKDALGFHFGMEAIEKFSNQPDHDNDGKEREFTIGNVTALTAFTMSIRPPVEVVPVDSARRSRAELGRKIFLGQERVTPEQACASCHTPSLHLNKPEVTIDNPALDVEFAGFGVGLSAQRTSTEQLPISRRFKRLRDHLNIDGRMNRNEALKQFRRAVEGAKVEGQPEGYQFNLTTMEAAVGAPSRPPSFTQPRLPSNSDHSVDVPLFSDLKRHDMGQGLQDEFQQQTDVEDIRVKEREFLTRPLWGVADTGPWLHDGRARTLREAIMLHRSEGSEANDVIDAFNAMSADDQDAVIEFLLTLQLSVDPRYSFDQW